MGILDFSFSAPSSGGLGLQPTGSVGLQAPAPQQFDLYSPGAVDYSLTSGGGAPGLRAPDGVWGDIGSRVGGTYGDLSPFDYSLGAQYSLAQLGQPNYGLQAAGAEGLQAQPSPASAGYALTSGNPSTGLAGTDPNFDPNRKAKDMIQRLLNFVPGGGLVNLGISALRGNNVLSGVLGQVAGLPGYMAGEVINAMRSDNPMAALTGSAARTGASVAGSAVGGPAAGAALSAGVGNMLAQNERAAFNAGPFGSGSALDGPSAGSTAPAAEGAGEGFGWNWGTAEKLLQLGSGLYGMKLAGDQRKAAEAAMARSDPWGTSGGRGMADAQLKQLMNDPTGVSATDPAYKLRMQGAKRAAAQFGQDSGAMAVAGANASTDWFNQRLAQLAGLAGATQSPGANSGVGLQGIASANDLAGSSLATLGYGVGSARAQQQQEMLALALMQAGR